MFGAEPRKMKPVSLGAQRAGSARPRPEAPRGTEAGGAVVSQAALLPAAGSLPLRLCRTRHRLFVVFFILGLFFTSFVVINCYKCE